MSEQLIPGAPTETGTYFAVVKLYTTEDPQRCVLHYQKHKDLYHAVGHAFSVDLQAGDVVGYVGESPLIKMEDIKYGQLWARHSELVEAAQVGTYRISFEGLKKAIEEVIRTQPNEQPVDQKENEAIDVDELWDEHSALIGDDIDDLSYWSGKEVMKKEDFTKAIQQFQKQNKQ